LHLYLTYHFLYRSGTRIVTLSRKQPLAIIYKQISPMQIELNLRVRSDYRNPNMSYHQGRKAHQGIKVKEVSGVTERSAVDY
jgi:hypothetical protein